MGGLRLAGEVAPALDTLNGVVARWLRRVQANDADPALDLVQLGAGAGLQVGGGTGSAAISKDGVVRTPRLEVADAAAFLARSGDDLAFTDPVAGTKTLSQLAAGGGGGAHQVGRAVRTAGDLSTTSTSFVDVDPATLSVTLTTGAGWVLLFFQATVWNSGGFRVQLDFAVDGARQGQSWGLVWTAGSSGHALNVLWPAQVAAGSHTFRVQWAVNGGTGWMSASAATSPAVLSVIDLA